MDNGGLPFGVTRRSQGEAERKRHEERAWGRDHFGDFPEQRNRDGGNSGTFDFGGDQTNCLIAERSDGRKENGVNPIFQEYSCGIGSRVFYEPSRRNYRTHEGDRPRRHFSYRPICRKFMKSFEWKRKISVGINSRMIKRRTRVILNKRREVRIFWNQTKITIANPRQFSKPTIIWQHQPRRGNKRDPCLGKRHAQTSDGVVAYAVSTERIALGKQSVPCF